MASTIPARTIDSDPARHPEEDSDDSSAPHASGDAPEQLTDRARFNERRPVARDNDDGWNGGRPLGSVARDPVRGVCRVLAAAIGTGAMLSMGLAWGLGPELMILAYIYLSLTSESNAELPESDGASDVVDSGAGARDGPTNPSVICIEHATGSNGDEIGRLIAARLGYRIAALREGRYRT